MQKTVLTIQRMVLSHLFPSRDSDLLKFPSYLEAFEKHRTSHHSASFGTFSMLSSGAVNATTRPSPVCCQPRGTFLAVDLIHGQIMKARCSKSEQKRNWCIACTRPIPFSMKKLGWNRTITLHLLCRVWIKPLYLQSLLHELNSYNKTQSMEEH